MSPDVTFDDEAVDFVLDCFDKVVDTDGYIVEGDSGERVLTPDGREIRAENLAITAEGSELFIDDNFASIIEFVERKQQR